MFLKALVLFSASMLVGGCFPNEAGPELSHFDGLAPAVGKPAPNFTLRDLDGKKIDLNQMVGEKPIVLQLGSHSCPVYRYRRFSMETLRKKYQGRVHFQLVYTKEAHPAGSKSPFADGEWLTWWNRLTDVRVAQPRTGADRLQQAQMSHRTLGINYPMAVDGMDDRVWRTYGAAASPAFVIDRRGRIVLRQVWIDPQGIDEALRKLLTQP